MHLLYIPRAACSGGRLEAASSAKRWREFSLRRPRKIGVTMILDIVLKYKDIGIQDVSMNWSSGLIEMWVALIVDFQLSALDDCRNSLYSISGTNS